MPASGRTQEERRQRTVRDALGATIDCLADVGYRGTSARVVAERAGVSQGAVTYYFPTRLELVIAALEELTKRCEADARALLPSLPSAPLERRLAVVDVMRSLFSGPLFVAWARLWFAAAEDDELRAAMVPVEQNAWDRMYVLVAEALPEIADGSDDGAWIGPVISMLRGLGFQEHFDPRHEPGRTDLWPRHRTAIATILAP